MSNQQRLTKKKPKSSTDTAPTRSRDKRSATPRPGRPTAARVEAINRAVLTEARDQFFEFGYANAQMETIAAAAGISKRTLYDRYPNKLALMKAVLAHGPEIWTDIWKKDAAPEAGGIPNLRERLKLRARRAMEICCSGEYARSEHFWKSLPPIDDLWRIRYEIGHKKMAQIIAGDISDLSPDQKIQPQTALQLAEMLMAMLYGWWEAHRGVKQITRKEAQAYADHVVNVLFDGSAAWTRE